MKHTQGPWRVVAQVHVERSNGQSVAMMERDSWSTMSEAEANARLIAAAPDLLAALQGALSLIESFKDCIPDWRDHLKVSDEGYSEKARAAIAKATT